jgi:hypothetical protein
MTHFSGPNIKMQPFIEKDLSLSGKPHVMALDDERISSLPLFLYAFVARKVQ